MKKQGKTLFSFLPILLGQNQNEVRESIVHHSISGQFSLRKGDWKMNFCAGSGGWSKPSDKHAEKEGHPKYQLYNLKDDIAESKNLYNKEKQKADELTQELKTIVDNGRSTTGATQKNATTVEWQ